MGIVKDKPTSISSERWTQNHIRYQVWISYFRAIYEIYPHCSFGIGILIIQTVWIDFHKSSVLWCWVPSSRIIAIFCEVSYIILANYDRFITHTSPPQGKQYSLSRKWMALSARDTIITWTTGSFHKSFLAILVDIMHVTEVVLLS